MSMGDRGWRDSTENYCDPYTLIVNGSTATAVMGQDYKQAAAIVGISISVNPAVGSGTVTLKDGSATADSDTIAWSVTIASAASQVFEYTAMLPRPLCFNSGIIVSATSVSGSVSLAYKPRY